jgi:outer membrane protein TolC
MPNNECEIEKMFKKFVLNDSSIGARLCRQTMFCWASSERNVSYSLVLVFLLCVSFQTSKVLALSALSLEQAIVIANENDPWLKGSFHRQQMLKSKSIAADQLPDPKVSIIALNFPVDTFDTNQEPMTQFRIGIAQQFPRGDTLKLRSQQLVQQSEAQPFLRQNRQAEVKQVVSILWLEIYRALQTITLIEKNRSLFSQLEDIVQSNYSFTLGQARQQDLVKSQLELTRFDDRLTIARDRLDNAIAQLSEWLPKESADVFSQKELTSSIRKVPTVPWLKSELYQANNIQDKKRLLPLFATHPKIKAIDYQITASKTSIELAKQAYQPQWGVNAAYGYRHEDRMGNDRADFLSLGITFDLPLSTTRGVGQQVRSTVENVESIKTEKSLALRQMIAGFTKNQSRLYRLNQRHDLYQLTLIPQIKEYVEISLRAYTNDDGDLAEVTRARIAELNAEIELLDITVERLKTIVQWNYFLTNDVLGVQQ